MSLHIATHAPGFYTISGYHLTSRHNAAGQVLASPPVCEIVFEQPGMSNGVTVEALEEVIARFKAEANYKKAAAPTVEEEDDGDAPVKNKGGRPRKVVPDAVEPPEPPNAA